MTSPVAKRGARAPKAAAPSAPKAVRKGSRDGNIILLDDRNFEREVLESDRPVLIDFTATWCGPCREIGPMVAEVADATLGTYKVAKLDVDGAPETVERFRIKGLPTLVVVKAGQEVARTCYPNVSKKKLLAMLAR